MDVSPGKYGCLGKIHCISKKANTSSQHKYLLPNSSQEEEEEGVRGRAHTGPQQDPSLAEPGSAAGQQSHEQNDQRQTFACGAAAGQLAERTPSLETSSRKSFQPRSGPAQATEQPLLPPGPNQLGFSLFKICLWINTDGSHLRRVCAASRSLTVTPA